MFRSNHDSHRDVDWPGAVSYDTQGGLDSIRYGLMQVSWDQHEAVVSYKVFKLNQHPTLLPPWNYPQTPHSLYLVYLRSQLSSLREKTIFYHQAPAYID